MEHGERAACPSRPRVATIDLRLSLRFVAQIDEIGLPRGLEQRPHVGRRIPPMTARRAHRADATLPGPIGDGALRDLEQQGDLPRAQEPTAVVTRRRVYTEELGH